VVADARRQADSGFSKLIATVGGREYDPARTMLGVGRVSLTRSTDCRCAAHGGEGAMMVVSRGWTGKAADHWRGGGRAGHSRAGFVWELSPSWAKVGRLLQGDSTTAIRSCRAVKSGRWKN